ncbi:MAG: cytochrome c family protein [Myxococcales bacterium]|nr:cytochrome c family protein [Myxococcales bacterium]
MTQLRGVMPGWAVALACAIAVAFGLAGASAASPEGGGSQALGGDAPIASAKVPDEVRAANDLSHGRAPMFGDALVPLEWMPPGTSASPIPSDEIFPPQQLTIRFNHKKHVKELKQTCKTCHAKAFDSSLSQDSLLPDPAKTCDNCHDVDHGDLARVVAGTEPNGQCAFCHLGEAPGAGGRVAKLVIPAPNLKMSHAAHLRRNIDCAQCHGQIEELELATRDQLPRMAGCFSCHARSTAASGEAKGACVTCHTTEKNGLLQTTFSTGELLPPEWLHGAAHTPDWIERHKGVAGANSELCQSCHASDFCADCHDGKVRPRDVHPDDWISQHAQAARQDNPRCVSCHQLTTFCGDCHRRVGVARDAPSANRLAGRRFHPEPATWTVAPRSPQHHSWEAERNLNACVSCHTERDCATCHATQGVRGGQGVNPHVPGFEAMCGAAYRRNPRPCLVCHASNDLALGACR